MPAERMNEFLEYPDFKCLFTSRKEIRRAEFRNLAGVGVRHFWIYSLALVISLVLMIPYMRESKDVLFTILMSIGASGVGASLLGYFNELALKQIERSRTVQEYNNYVAAIYFHAFKIFACRSFLYMKQIDPQNGQASYAQQNAGMILSQFQILAPKIESFIFQYGALLDDDTIRFYQGLCDQLVHFEGSLRSPADVSNLIDVMEGIRNWLRKYFALENIKKHFLR